jgi:hypothetical protein
MGVKWPCFAKVTPPQKKAPPFAPQKDPQTPQARGNADLWRKKTWAKLRQALHEKHGAVIAGVLPLSSRKHSGHLCCAAPAFYLSALQNTPGALSGWIAIHLAFHVSNRSLLDTKSCVLTH